VSGFINDVIKRNHLDVEIRRSALRGLKRFLEEHKDFIKNVGSEALLQKLQQQPISTEKSVPYSVPPVIPLDVFDKVIFGVLSVFCLIEGARNFLLKMVRGDCLEACWKVGLKRELRFFSWQEHRRVQFDWSKQANADSIGCICIAKRCFRFVSSFCCCCFAIE
jgi:hypothetical protein